jgi:hypothetical protein
MPENAPRHAYLIAAHEKPAQLKLLLSLIDHPQNDIYIHIDAKAKGFSEDELRAAAPRSRVSVHPIRLDARWGDELFINAINFLLSHAIAVDHAYYHLLSGADLPLKPQSEIHAFFASHAGKEFVDFDRDPVDPDMLMQRIGSWHLRQPTGPLKKKLFRIFEPLWLGAQKRLGVNRLKGCDVKFQKGAVWFSITHDCAVYALQEAWKYRRCYENSICADELWLQTVLVNSPFMERRAFMGFGDECAATMRYVDWSGGGRSPRVLTSADYDALKQSGMLFARKFDESVDGDIIRRIAGDVLTGK